GHTARCALLFGIRVPIGRPLPGIARHLMQPEAVGRIGANRGRRPVPRVVLPGKVAVPKVRLAIARRLRLVTPDELRALETAACRALPLGLVWQRLTSPGGIGLGVLAGHVDDRMISDSLPPTRARRPCPPLLH